MSDMFGTAHLPVHERLYHTPIGTTQSERKAFEASFKPSPSTTDELQAANKLANVTKVPTGLTIVQYPPARKEQKQDTETTARGYTRNKLGGFYTS